VNIAIHIEGGVVQRVTSDNALIHGATVAVVHDDVVDRAVAVSYSDELQALITQALDNSTCHGIGIACELAGEQLIALSRTAITDPTTMTRQVDEVMRMLMSMVERAHASPLAVTDVTPDAIA
jgi:hypothetical protein